MRKRKKSGFELTRASDEGNRQWRSWRDKASFQRQNIILWELDWYLGEVVSCKKTQQRRVDQIFSPNPRLAQKAISRRKRALETSKSPLKCNNARRVKGDWSSFENPASSSLEFFFDQRDDQELFC